MLTAVTGATGFVGRRVCEVIAARGERVVALGRNVLRFPAVGTRVIADLADRDALRAAFAGADAVVHCAALASPWGSRTAFERANVEGTRNALDAARAAGVKRFVHVSSSSVLFDGRPRIGVREDEPIPARLRSHYARTKARAEEIVRAAAGIEAVILRPRIVFGPGDSAILPRLVAAARAKRLPLIGDGRTTTDVVFVDNFADAVLLARDGAAAAGRVYHVSNDEPVRVWDLVRSLLSALDLEVPSRRLSRASALAIATALETIHRLVPRLGEPPLTRFAVEQLTTDLTLDVSAIKRDLGYRPRVSVADGVARTIAAMRAAA